MEVPNVEMFCVKENVCDGLTSESLQTQSICI